MSRKNNSVANRKQKRRSDGSGHNSNPHSRTKKRLKAVAHKNVIDQKKILTN